MGEAVLVFPAGTPEGLAYRDRAKARGLRVVGASSLEHDPAEGAYEAWERLPYVHDPSFDKSLADLVKRHGIGAIHTPHFVVWRHLSEHLAEIAPGAELSGGDSPQEHAYQALRERLQSSRTPCFWPALPGKPALTMLERVALVRLVEAILGPWGDAEMLAAMEAMRHAPAGDVVEIGAGWGRASALLVWLAKRYQIGAVLCIHPRAEAADADPSEPDETLRIFEINLAPLADGQLNYLREPSADAAVAYRAGLTVRTEAFGATAYEGRIAFLHVAASRGEPVAEDCALWAPRIVPGGWIVFDDYDQGPPDSARRAADTFLAREAGRIAARFQAGGALFIQLKR